MTHLIGPPLSDVTNKWLAEIRLKFPEEFKRGIKEYGQEIYFLFDLRGVGKTMNDWHEERGSEDYERNLNNARRNLRDHHVSEELILASEDLGRRMILRAEEIFGQKSGTEKKS